MQEEAKICWILRRFPFKALFTFIYVSLKSNKLTIEKNPPNLQK